MKLTKKLEAEVLKFYKAYWDAYLNGNMKTLASMLDDNITIFGTAVSEVFNNKKDALKFYKATADQLVDKAQFRNRQINLNAVDDTILVSEKCDFYFLLEEKWTYYGHVRVTAVIKQTNRKWKVVQQHASFPDMKADEGEQVAAEKIKEENLQLRDAVKRRTIELEERNRDLEIETAVERVRAKALAMQSSDDIHEVVRSLRNELFGLKLEGIIGATICLKQKDAQVRLWDITDVDTTGRYGWDIVFDMEKIDPRIWVKRIWDSRKKLIAIEQDSNDLKRTLKWLGQYDKKTADQITKLLKKNKINHGWHRAVKLANGRLITDFVNEAPAEINSVLLKMGAAFDLAYKRFLDLQKAEAQTREAQIEIAVERVRAKALAMHKSGEIMGVAVTMRKELESLNISGFDATTITLKQDDGTVRLWDNTSAKQHEDGTWENTEWIFRLEENHPDFYINRIWNRNKKYFVEEQDENDLKITIDQVRRFDKEMADVVKHYFKENKIKHAWHPTVQLTHGRLNLDFYSAPEPEIEIILLKMGAAFDLAYKRFLDLQKAESQARESQIELGLERVRARAMAMQRSNELEEVVLTISERLVELGLSFDGALIFTFDKATRNILLWIASNQLTTPIRIDLPYDKSVANNLILKDLWNAIENGEHILNKSYSGKAKDDYFRYVARYNASIIPEDVKISQLKAKSWTVSLAAEKNSVLAFDSWSGQVTTNEDFQILKRFAKVFEQTYTRFLDLKKAEAQAREANIQLALERIRAKSLAMHHTSELQEVVNIVGQQLHDINIDINGGVFICINDEVETDLPLWASGGAADYVQKVTVPFLNRPVFITLRDAIKRKNNFFTEEHGYEEKIGLFEHLFKYPPWNTLSSQRKQELVSRAGGYTRSVAVSNHTSIAITNHHGKKFSDDDNEVLKRFGNVFEQSYTRFLDLQKAETQAREAQIELGLERVRARAMAMQNSDELKELIGTVFTELTKLDLVLTRCLIMIFDPKTNGSTWWMANSEDASNPIGLTVKYHEQPPYLAYINAWKERKIKWQYVLEGKIKKRWDDHIFSETELSQLPDFVIAGMRAPNRVYLNVSFNNFGNLTLASLEPLSDEHFDILLRFAKVFDLTYTRFNDLQKAEAQAREAQIELGLERVRARAMAMQKSDELKELVSTVSVELGKLDIVLDRCFIVIYDINTLGATWWMSNPETPSNPLGLFVKYHEYAPYLAHLKAWQDRKVKWQYVLEGDNKKNWDKFLFVDTELSMLPDFVIADMRGNEKVYLSSSFNNFGYLSLATLEPLSEDQFDILLRFAKVFDLTYTRFNDLQKAEAQAREAQIELGLERVRARAMAMQRSDELSELVDTVFKELTKLDFALTWCIINIIDESSMSNTVWAANPDINKPPESYHMLFEDYPFHHAMMKGWKERNAKAVYVLEGKEKKIYDEYLFNKTEFRRVPAAAQAASKAMEKYVVTFSFSNFGGLQTVGDVPLSDANLDILSRFGKVFDLTYTRFNDLKQAEEQARESQIQLAMERVRARTMAMQKSDELAETASLLFTQIADLGTNSWSSGFIIFQPDELSINSWMSKPDGSMGVPFNIPVTEDPFFIKIYEAYKRREEFFVMESSGKELEETYRYMFSLPGAAKALGAIEDLGFQMPTFQVTHCVFFATGFLMFITYEPCQEMWEIFKRFGKVFEQTYTRFLDLQKAEAQAKESQIQLALERVRARTMAMQKSDELLDIINTAFQRMKELNLEMDSANIFLPKENNSRDIEMWIATADYNYSTRITLPYFDVAMSKDLWNASQAGSDYFSKQYRFEEKNEWFKLAFEYSDFKFISDDRKKYILEAKDYALCASWTKNIGIQTVSYSGKTLNDNEAEILKRFVKVLDQAYIRFLDLQKAEAQTREAQIEAALEKVRSRTMGMQKSDELGDVATVLFKELNLLVKDLWTCGFVLCEKGRPEDEWWLSTENGFIPAFYLPNVGDATHYNIYQGWLQGEEYHTEQLEGKALQEHYDWLMTIPIAKQIFDGFATAGYERPNWQKLHCAYFSKGYLCIITQVPCPDEHIFQRFAQVFDLTYTRFLDLQKAEAQAREARIEAVLERVRSRTMAMQKSDELTDVAGLLFEQVSALGIKTWTAGFNVWSEDNNSYVDYITSPNGGFIEPYTVYTNTAEALTDISNARKSGVEFDVQYVEGEKIKQLYLALTRLDEKQYEIMLQDGIRFPSHQYEHFVFGSKVSLMFITYEPVPEAHDIFKRLGKVFEQTYTRFLDLQKAEAQAREAQIEAALERVRSRTMAMHSSEELDSVIKTVYSELKKLDVSFERCFIMIFDESKGATWWMGGPDNDLFHEGFYVQYHSHPPHLAYLKGWEERQQKWNYWLGGQIKKDWDEFVFNKTELSKLPPIVSQYMRSYESANLSASFENFGCLTTGGRETLSEESFNILSRFAKVFDVSYTRFRDLQRAEAQAREAQIELGLERVRARAMAMQKSDELADAAQLLYQEFGHLGINTFSCGYMFIDEAKQTQTAWVVLPDGSLLPNFIVFPLTGDHVLNSRYKDWKEKTPLHVFEIKGEANKEHHRFLSNYVPPFVIEDIFSKVPDRIILNCANFSNGYLLILATEHFSQEDQQTIIRFAKVFEMTYTRFNDLKQAEAQARESQIQLALERVRARTMAMQKSDELAEVATVLFQQVKALGVPQWVCGFNIWELGDKEFTWYPGSPDGEILSPCKVPLTEHPVFISFDESRRRGDELFVYEKEGEFQADHYRYMMTVPGMRELLQNMLDAGLSFPTFQIDHLANFSYGNMVFITYEPVPEMHDVFKRFAKVFEQTYTRFLDLQKAEAQAREAKIEAALEKIRARTMGMQRSDELPQAASLLFQQLQILGMPAFAAGYCIWEEDKQAITLWMSSEGVLQPPFKAPTTEDELFIQMRKGYEDGKSLHVVEMGGEELVAHYQYMRTLPVVGDIFDAILKAGHSLPVFQVMHQAYFSKGFLLIITYEPVPEAHEIFKRFASVFDQTYTRFLDLQKAEAQAKEAQIEAALEKVRSRSLAMHKSDELQEVVNTVFERLTELNIEMDSCNIAIFKEGTRDFEFWIASHFQKKALSFKVSGDWAFPLIQELINAREKGQDFFSKCFSFEEKNEWFTFAFENTDFKRISLERRKYILETKVYALSIAFSKHTGIQINNYSEKLPSDGEIEILKRFSKVFEQAYIRFLDLQKAEAQAREAKIEAALEKVRTSTMAMQRSEDLSQTAFVLFNQFKELGEAPERIFIATFDDHDSGVVDLWGTDQGGNQLNKLFRLPVDEPTMVSKIIAAWKKKERSLVIDLQGEDLKTYLGFLKQAGIPVAEGIMTDRRVQTVACFSNGVIGITTPAPQSIESIHLLERFAGAFDLTYTRFLDLQKAEAQAREATIEAALERVRGKAMAMHNSNDLSVTTSMIITELRKLDIKPLRCGVGILNKETNKAQLYTATSSPEGDSFSVVGWVLLEKHPVLEQIYEKWLAGEDYFPELSGDSRRSYYEQLLAGLSVPVPDFKDSKKHYGHFFSFSVGCLYAWSEIKYNEEEIKILKRFTTIIDLTFRRYFELQKSEANAKEAIKQAALDRIRADIASMRTINDLERITPLIWNELTVLGIPFIRCGVFIMDEEQQLIHTFLSTPDGKAIAAFHLPYDTPGNLQKVVINWKKKNRYIDHWDEAEFIQFADILVTQGALVSAENYLKTIPRGGFYLHFLPFLQGMLYVGNTAQIKEEGIELIQHVADAFSTAYARYEDFNKLEAAKQQVDKTLTDLKQTQQQLVQSEKMASLGELTAGIAHEIQNPLNFVNNFSDVSSELLDEMKTELEKGNKEDAIAIVEDVKQNLEKILHHGRRADAIVKGMLQHSRTSSGQKESTDINVLADEYLRLAFHGLRAKDKSFNAKFETDFDTSIEKINIIPQDIGRVILNLINNAFYTVSEKKKQNTNGYEPTVTVTTRKENGNIEIRVKDNGNGIPKKILDKIFQPFFTTKPTGQGTGLGLSLSYDIVKAHGGELKVETKEGEGTEFIIQLSTN